ncbi:hypothetical protein ACGF07_31825 [Kitasatospora sp. NPDC048194]|uniref:hypothetical protein n=1 Tax=Kitasatospora sp. NPDC048194 TaxID=3364045 RepID=UPI00372173B5
MIAICSRIRTFAVDFITSTNKTMIFAAAFGVAWAADSVVGDLATIRPTAAVITLLVSTAADLCAVVWWRYYAPELPAYATREDAIEHLIAVGVDPAELELIFDVKLIDYAKLAAAEDGTGPAR